LKSLRGECIDFKITEHQGRIVKLTGDGILAEFPSVVSAVACAAEMQRGLRERAAETPADRRIEFRIGVNLGDVIVEQDDIYSDGITEDIITDLSKISGLFVVARHTAFTYKSKLVKVEQVGRELGVAFVLEGSVRKAGARVRVTAQLTGATTGGHVWAERFDRDLTDIFAIQDEITHAI